MKISKELKTMLAEEASELPFKVLNDRNIVVAAFFHKLEACAYVELRNEVAVMSRYFVVEG